VILAGVTLQSDRKSRVRNPKIKKYFRARTAHPPRGVSCCCHWRWAGFDLEREMIRNITIQGYKSFSRDQATRVAFDGTKQAALFYGLNGAGKSAIGQVVQRHGTADPIANCSVAFTAGTAYECFVYNEAFVEANFRNTAGFPGIFSIGQQDADALTRMETLEKESLDMDSRRGQLSGELEVLGQEAEKAQEVAAEATWRVYRDHSEGILGPWLGGYGKNKKGLFQKVRDVALAVGETPPSVDDLHSRMEDLAAEQATEKGQVSLDFTDLMAIEMDSIWGKAVVGSQDSRLAAAIQQIGNIDWVHAGKKYVTEHSTDCPFCQQLLPPDFKEQLALLIEGDYQKDLEKIQALGVRYEARIADLTAAARTILADGSFARENAELEKAWSNLHLLLTRNLYAMQQKYRQAGHAAEIELSADSVFLVNKALTQIKERIDTYNQRIRNRQAERVKVGADFWKRMRFDHAGVLEVYNSAKETADAKIREKNSFLANVIDRRREIQAELIVLRANSAGTAKAVEGINARLKGLGIEGFTIKRKEGEGNLYCLTRPGVDVDDYLSLSEGEKTMISFFYFVELVNGSAFADRNLPQNRKIVFIDDPISSLSHTYVYDIVSIIVEEMIRGAKKAKQVCVLTHSLFFYHEMVKQLGGKSAHKQCEFFRVSKSQHSSVRAMAWDEIKSEYQAFWQVIKDARNGTASIAAVPNAMRCICEHFFSFTDQQDDFKQALLKLSNEDQSFKSLARYLDRNSHADLVNLTDFGDHDMAYFLDKFEAVFRVTKYPGHYNQMMGPPVVEQPVPVEAA